MTSIRIDITNPDGLTSRHAAELVSEANKYVSDIKMICGEDSCDLKSILNVFGTIVAHDGDFVTVTAEGIDETEALAGFTNLVNRYHF